MLRHNDSFFAAFKVLVRIVTPIIMAEQHLPEEMRESVPSCSEVQEDKDHSDREAAAEEVEPEIPPPSSCPVSCSSFHEYAPEQKPLPWTYINAIMAMICVIVLSIGMVLYRKRDFHQVYVVWNCVSCVVWVLETILSCCLVRVVNKKKKEEQESTALEEKNKKTKEEQESAALEEEDKKAREEHESATIEEEEGNQRLQRNSCCARRKAWVQRIMVLVSIYFLVDSGLMLYEWELTLHHPAGKPARKMRRLIKREFREVFANLVIYAAFAGWNYRQYRLDTMKK